VTGTADTALHRAARRVLGTDPVMAALMRACGPCRLDAPEPYEPFEALTRAIAHQQLHAVAAERILGRFIAGFGAGGFPTPQQVLDAPDQRLRADGFSYAKIAALKDLAKRSAQGLVPSRDELLRLGDDQIIERLSVVRGVGRWTVEMLLMFQLRRRDVLPVDDFGVRNGFRLAYRLRGMPRPRALAQFGERWKPYRSIAAWYLWRAVELERCGGLPRCDSPPRIALIRARGAPRTRAVSGRGEAPRRARK
jgi:DNA-3-methyladenine glycosylase II